MKPTNWILFVLALVAAWMMGRHFERMATVSAQVNRFEDRLAKLEQINLRQEERWGWAKRIGGTVKGWLTFGK
jgi:hypothetical protein